MGSSWKSTVSAVSSPIHLKRLNLLLDYLMAFPGLPLPEGVHLTEVMDGSGTHCLCPCFPVLLAPLAHQCRKSSCYRSWNQRQVGTTPFPSRISQTFVLAFFRLGFLLFLTCLLLCYKPKQGQRWKKTCPRR